MHTFEELVSVVKILRSEQGCSWDRKQTFESLKPCILDEAREVAEADAEAGDGRRRGHRKPASLLPKPTPAAKITFFSSLSLLSETYPIKKAAIPPGERREQPAKTF